MPKHLEELVEKISKDKDFIKWAVCEDGLALRYIRFKKRGGHSDAWEKKNLLKNLSRLLISDNDKIVDLIGRLFDYDDLLYVEEHIIGNGKIGGKSTGMLLAYKALDKYKEQLGIKMEIPESWYIGSDVFSNFLRKNNLGIYEHVKFLKLSYEKTYKEFLNILPITEFDEKIVKDIKKILKKTKGQPLILRSSSLLEDSFGTPFAGKYDSFFLPNNFSLEENLDMFLNAIKEIYASIYHPDSMEYRKKKGLLDEYEAMAILVQKVVGNRIKLSGTKEYFFPLIAGVCFSQNCYPWAEEVKIEDGAARMAMGLGTAVVDITENERIFICDLSRFSMPVKNMDDYLRVSQRHIHAIDLNERDFKKTVKKIPLDSINELENIKGIEDVLITANPKTGKLYPANRDRIKEWIPFITFPGIKKWGKNLRDVIKIIEFTYAKRNIISYLNTNKWIIAGEIINLIDTYAHDLDYVESGPGIELVNIYHDLKEDNLIEYNEVIIEEYFKGKHDIIKNLLDKLLFVSEAKRLLENIDDYFKFYEIYNNIRHAVLKRELKRIISKNAIDFEFAICNNILYVLQCRPLSMYSDSIINIDIEKIPNSKKIIDTRWPCPNAFIDHVNILIYVDDTKYSLLNDEDKYNISRKIGGLNKKYNEFMLILPGRAGSRCPELGVPIGYKDINNARLLVEYPLVQNMPEFSYGSHFYLDLVGDNIYTFAIERDAIFKKEFLKNNVIEAYFENTLLVSKIPLNIYMIATEKRIICELK